MQNITSTKTITPGMIIKGRSESGIEKFYCINEIKNDKTMIIETIPETYKGDGKTMAGLPDNLETETWNYDLQVYTCRLKKNQWSWSCTRQLQDNEIQSHSVSMKREIKFTTVDHDTVCNNAWKLN